MFLKPCRSFAVAGALVLSVPFAVAMGGKPKAENEAAVTARIAPVGRVDVASAPKAAAPANGRSGEDIYKAVCAACHDSGVAGAPKTGDKAAWAPRIGLGLDALVKSAKAGKNAMPPNGGSDANEVELARSIAFLANKSGASFKAP